MTHVILIIIDGCRPDALQRGVTPNIDALAAAGAACLKAVTVTPSLTLPAHYSLFTSQKPIGHNVLTNTGRPNPSPATASLFEVAKYNGMFTAAVYSWEHLRNLAPPEALDFVYYLNTLQRPQGDRNIAQAAADCLARFKPALLFVYLEGVDQAGHASGWMSPAYFDALAEADRAVGTLKTAIADAGIADATDIILHSDHGGSGTHHQEATPENLTIPWIAWGPDIHRGLRIEAPVSILDTAPTIAHLLGIRPHYSWVGRPLSEIVTGRRGGAAADRARPQAAGSVLTLAGAQGPRPKRGPGESAPGFSGRQMGDSAAP
jgi:arylsulfatase A-like enzyme